MEQLAGQTPGAAQERDAHSNGCLSSTTPLRKLWLYTNYDCNLRCTYCVARSNPKSLRRALGFENIRRLVDEAECLGFEEVFFTGGEPFLLEDIYEMLAYSSARLKTTVLTNGSLLFGRRLEQLSAVANDRLIVQVSLDGARPADHDVYRGRGTWDKAVASIRALKERGFRVVLSTTETPANSAHLDLLCDFHRNLGISEEDHLVRGMAKRGCSEEGMELRMENLVPEVTVNLEGVFWHPLSTDDDMKVSDRIFPLSEVLDCFEQKLQAMAAPGGPTQKKFT